MATQVIGTVVSLGVSALSGALTPTKSVFNQTEVGKLENVSVRKTGAGWSLGKVYGRCQIVGCPIFWAVPRREEIVVTKEVSGQPRNKFGGGGNQTVNETSTYKYFGTFAFAVCDGGAQINVKQIKFNDKLWFNAEGQLDGTIAEKNYKLENFLKIYTGASNQNIDPTIQSVEGNQNGDRNFRHLVYCVVTDFPLDEFGGELPSTIDVIVERKDNNVNRIDNVIYEVAETVGLIRNVDIKCGGLLNSVNNGAQNLRINGIFKQDGGTASDFINELVQRYFLVTYLDNDGAIVFELPENVQASVTGDWSKLGAVDYGSQPGDPYSELMPDTSELPSAVTISFSNLSDDFNGDSETKVYPLASHYNPKTISSSLFLMPDEAKWWAWKYIQFAWDQSRRFTVSLLPEDAVTLTEAFRFSMPLFDGGSNIDFSIASIVIGANLVGEIELYQFNGASFTAQPSVPNVNNVVFNGGTIQLQPNINSGVTVVSFDGLTTYVEGIDYSVNTTTGELTVLGGAIANGSAINISYNAQPNFTVNVPLPESKDYGEPIVTVVETNRIRLSDPPCIYVSIARGATDFGATTLWARVNGGAYSAQATTLTPTTRGTLQGSLALASGLDTVNTATVIMTEGILESISQNEFDNLEIVLLIGSEQIAVRDVNLVSANTYELDHLQRGVNGTVPVAHSNGEPVYLARGRVGSLTLLPISPDLTGQSVDIKAVPFNVTLVDVLAVTNYTILGTYYKAYAGSNLVATQRQGGVIYLEWVINDTGAESIIPQQFEIDIFDGSTVVRTIASNDNSVTYDIPEQIADFGSIQSSLTVKIYQLSVVGRGYPLSATITPTPIITIPLVSDFSPRSGQIGDAITIYGFGFSGALSGAINANAITSFTVVNDNVITGVIATATTTGKVSVTNTAGTGESLADFVVITSAVDWGDIGGTLSDQTDLQDALDNKENTITSGTTNDYWRGDKTFQTLDKNAVGLGNVDNTSDLNKPISTATQTALNGKFNNPTGTVSQYIRGDGSLATLPTPTVNTYGSFFAAAPTVKNIPLFTATRATTINELRGVYTSAGTATISIQVNGVNVTGLTNLFVTSTPQNFTATEANTVAIGARVTVNITAVSSAADLEFTMGATLN